MEKIILRDYQLEACTKATNYLWRTDNCLLIAPTGAGKTVMMASICKALSLNRVLVLQHRNELLAQNMEAFKSIVGDHLSYSLISADNKSFYGNLISAWCKQFRDLII